MKTTQISTDKSKADVFAKVRESLQESIAVKQLLLEQHVEVIVQIANEMIEVLWQGNKILLFGNGGSAADSQHIAAELVGRFGIERPSMPAIALTTDTSILTAIANDYHYDEIFARQIEGLAQIGDIAIGISTSGNSRNVIRAVETANARGVKTIALTGGTGGELAKKAHRSLIIPSKNTQRIQEAHITVGHILCELIEGELVRDPRKNKIIE